MSSIYERTRAYIIRPALVGVYFTQRTIVHLNLLCYIDWRSMVIYDEILDCDRPD